jgi:hypothetical protein
VRATVWAISPTAVGRFAYVRKTTSAGCPATVRNRFARTCIAHELHAIGSRKRVPLHSAPHASLAHSLLWFYCARPLRTQPMPEKSGGPHRPQAIFSNEPA